MITYNDNTQDLCFENGKGRYHLSTTDFSSLAKDVIAKTCEQDQILREQAVEWAERAARQINEQTQKIRDLEYDLNKAQQELVNLHEKEQIKTLDYTRKVAYWKDLAIQNMASPVHEAEFKKNLIFTLLNSGRCTITDVAKLANQIIKEASL